MSDSRPHTRCPACLYRIYRRSADRPDRCPHCDAPIVPGPLATVAAPAPAPMTLPGSRIEAAPGEREP